MIKKEEMLPGTRLQIRPVIKTGTAFPIRGLSLNNVLTHIRMTQSPGSMMDGHYPIHSGDIVEVVRGPKRKDGINTIEVRDAAGVEGHVFWCEMRASADIV